MSGILAIWNDCIASRIDAYEAWYREEHLPERLNLPGFLVARRFAAIAASRQFLTTYEVSHVDVFHSTEYLARLAAPTPRTMAMMTSGFKNMSRTACSRHEVRGALRGSVVLTIALATPDALGRLRERTADLLQMEAAHTHSEVWGATELGASEASAEEALRGSDARIGACLALEYLRPEEALRDVRRLTESFPDADIGTYRLLCTLNKEDL